MIQPEVISILLGYGVLVASLVLFTASWLGILKKELFQSAIKRMTFLGLTIGAIAVWLWIERWLIPYFKGDEYTRYAFSERVIGPYGYGIWMPLSYSILATLLVVCKKTRKFLVSWIGQSVVGFGPILYEVWMYSVVNKHRDFLSTSYKIEFPEWYQILTTALLAGAFCLLVVLYPQLKKLVIK